MRPWLLLLFAGALTASVGFVAAQHGSTDDPRNTAVKTHASLEATTRVPPEITEILNRSCMDCHSGQTRWPWYSHLPVIGAQMEAHVMAGRSALHLSGWSGHIAASEREDKLETMCIQAKSRKMPLPEYLILHPHSRLTDQEIK